MYVKDVITTPRTLVIDDMREYLTGHPFYAPRSRSDGTGGSDHNRAPGVWVGQTYLGLLQYVDDAVEGVATMSITMTVKIEIDNRLLIL